MLNFFRIISIGLLLTTSISGVAGRCGECNNDQKCLKTCDRCCEGFGGVQYCDSSAGRLVCNNGFYSSCYCNRHAVMDLKNIQGCCLWQGGVLDTDDVQNIVICNDGSVSELCSIQETNQSHSPATWK